MQNNAIFKNQEHAFLFLFLFYFFFNFRVFSFVVCNICIVVSKRSSFFATNFLQQWFPRDASGPITHATFSCDSQSIYVSFEDGSIGVLTASTLRLRCRINPNAYLPPNPRCVYSFYKINSLRRIHKCVVHFSHFLKYSIVLIYEHSLRVHPLVIAAHPSEPNQFALGLSDGGVHVLEPSESEGKWGTSPPVENGAGPSTVSGAAAPDQPQR